MSIGQPPVDAEHGQVGETFRAELPGDLTSARRARSAIRQALAAWAIADPSGDAELLVSEIVANAAEHGGGRHIGLTLSRHHEPGGQAAITCEVTDPSPALPQPRQAGPNGERGRGMAIVAALATTSGVRAGPTGKTTWFTLAVADPALAAGRAGALGREHARHVIARLGELHHQALRADPELEAGA